MTLRVRIAAVASLAVALAVLVAAVSLYLIVRSDLRGQIDQSLTQRSRLFLAPPPGGASLAEARGSSPGSTLGSSPTTHGASDSRGAGTPAADEPVRAALRALARRYGFPSVVAPARFGEASGYVQFISPQGKLLVPGGQGSSPAIAASAQDAAIAKRGRGRVFSDRTIKGTHVRVLTVGTPRGAVVIARPLTEVDHEVSRILLILLVVGLVGIAIAVALGVLVARTALTPIARFTARTESLTGSLDLSERLPVRGRDELARLASSFNATLDALERSVEAQRHLVADASHELRTPLSSLRANIQILGDADRLPPADQESLRRDIVEELDELTSLVSDVVELARGPRGESAREDVRVDGIVADAVERARRRSDVRFAVELEPTTVRGEPERINRAVSNLLDNARKWSPPGGIVEVDLRAGVLTVRDHGPGFPDGDLERVFERFYRAQQARSLPGSGLGLAIVRQAAESHNGYAEAENAPGGGARLRVSFGPSLRVAPGVEQAEDAATAALGLR